MKSVRGSSAVLKEEGKSVGGSVLLTGGVVVLNESVILKEEVDSVGRSSRKRWNLLVDHRFSRIEGRGVIYW